jgi:hypothetical protein
MLITEYRQGPRLCPSFGPVTSKPHKAVIIAANSIDEEECAVDQGSHRSHEKPLVDADLKHQAGPTLDLI